MPVMIKFYTLLYINSEESNLGNSVSGDYKEKIEKYVCCCSLFSKTLKANGAGSLCVISNNPGLVLSVDPELECLSIPFKTHVPAEIPFASAHCKIDVLTYFSTLEEGSYSILLDSDMICTSGIPYILERAASEGTGLFYNVTGQQFPAFTAERMCHDKELLVKGAFAEDFTSTGLWAGGEFIGGSPAFFKALSGACYKILPVYLEHHKEMFHNGDEMIVSTALEYLMQRRKISAFDAGQMQLTGRYYDSNTCHVQQLWKHFRQQFLIHLPMDKDFLAAYGDTLLVKSIVAEEIRKKVTDTEFHMDSFMHTLENHLSKNKTFLKATVRADRALQVLTGMYYGLRAFVKKITGHGNEPVNY